MQPITPLAPTRSRKRTPHDHSRDHQQRPGRRLPGARRRDRRRRQRGALHPPEGPQGLAEPLHRLCARRGRHRPGRHRPHRLRLERRVRRRAAPRPLSGPGPRGSPRASRGPAAPAQADRRRNGQRQGQARRIRCLRPRQRPARQGRVHRPSRMPRPRRVRLLAVRRGADPHLRRPRRLPVAHRHPLPRRRRRDGPATRDQRRQPGLLLRAHHPPARLQAEPPRARSPAWRRSATRKSCCR